MLCFELLQFLPLHEIVKLALVCKQFLNIIQNPNEKHLSYVVLSQFLSVEIKLFETVRDIEFEMLFPGMGQIQRLV